MRSALWQAIDLIGPDADPEDLVLLWCVISDLVRRRHRTPWSEPAWSALDGPERVRRLIAAACPSTVLLDGTEPDGVLRRLGLVPRSGRGVPPGD